MDNEGGSTILAVAERLCCSCGISKPIHEFRFKSRDSGLRHSECNSCAAGQRRGRRTYKRRRELQGYLERACDASNPANFGTVTRTEAVVRGMMVRFGGLDQFTAFWHGFIQHAHASGKAHLVQRSIETLARFVELTDRNRSDQPSGEASEEGARELLKEHLVRMIFEDPSLGATILEELGWRVEPPAEESGEAEAFVPSNQPFESRLSDAARPGKA